MHIAQLFLVVCISVATANAIFDVELLQEVNCGGKVCKNFATCKDGKTCVCLEGTKGDECEEITGCAKLKAKCDKIGSDCFYNNYTRAADCKCSDEKNKFNGEICTACSCGDFEKRCDFFKDKKSCLCKDGYKELNGTCTSCTCGPHTQSCSFRTGSKYCLCDDGYEFKLGTCEVCDCGTYSSDCVYDVDDGAKLCTCTDGRKDRLGTCTVCECGPDTWCTFNKTTGEKDCICLGEACRDHGTPWVNHPAFIACIVASAAVVVLIPAYVVYRRHRG